jgi:hypothetical protein
MPESDNTATSFSSSEPRGFSGPPGAGSYNCGFAAPRKASADTDWLAHASLCSSWSTISGVSEDDTTRAGQYSSRCDYEGAASILESCRYIILTAANSLPLYLTVTSGMISSTCTPTSNVAALHFLFVTGSLELSFAHNMESWNGIIYTVKWVDTCSTFLSGSLLFKEYTY